MSDDTSNSAVPRAGWRVAISSATAKLPFFSCQCSWLYRSAGLSSWLSLQGASRGREVLCVEDADELPALARAHHVVDEEVRESIVNLEMFQEPFESASRRRGEKD